MELAHHIKTKQATDSIQEKFKSGDGPVEVRTEKL